MRHLGKSALFFIAIGIALYALVYYAAELLLYRTGKANPFFKIATVEAQSVDWLVLGASHAMPLDFDGFNALMEEETGLRILNLAAQGAGPLYNRFVLEQFLVGHEAASLLYVADSFAFHSRMWNEDRFADAGLLRRTPFSLPVARGLAGYSRDAGVDPRAMLDYLSGFSKVNNRERFQPDIWEGERQFDRAFRPSAVATRQRIDYLYPQGTPADALARYLGELATLLDRARARGVRVHVVKPPLPPQFHRQLPEEAAFDAALSDLLGERDIPFEDLSGTIPEPRFYFDTDHLNRAGATEFFTAHLRSLLESPAVTSAPDRP